MTNPVPDPAFQPPPALPGASNPFPGLRPYGAGEAQLFFGRATHVEALLRKLQERRLLAVIGSSGSGKSSLVLAGILPRLDRGYRTPSGHHWRVAVLRPGSDPIGNLATALRAAVEVDDEQDYDALDPALPSGAHRIASLGFATATPNNRLERDLLRAELERSSLGLVEAVRGLPLAPGENLLLVVDQFEELFRFRRLRQGQVRDAARAFVLLLLRACEASDVPIYVMLTMRSDFLGECVEFPGLAEAISDGQYLVPRLDRDQRAEVVRGPVAVAGASIAPALVQRLLNDAGDLSDQLPVLQHALMLTFERARQLAPGPGPFRLELCHYVDVGEMAGALSRHADEAYADVGRELGARGQRVLELLFRCLTDAGARGGGVRRPCQASEVIALAKTDLPTLRRIVQIFAREGRGFLVHEPRGELQADSTLDISHESLMRKWRRLGAWLDEEAALAQRLHALSEDEREYAAGKRSLLRDPELSLALKWQREAQPSQAAAARYGVELGKIERFLRQSWRAERLRVFGLWGAIGLAFLGLGLLALKLQQSRRVAERLATQALLARGKAEAAEARSRQALRAAKMATLIRLATDSQKDSARAAAYLREAAGPAKTRPAAWQKLATTLTRPLLAWRLEGHGEWVASASFSADGERLLTASQDGSARIWESDSGRTLHTLSAEMRDVRMARFSANGASVVTLSDDYSARLWDAASGQLKFKLAPHERDLLDATFSVDSKLLATASWDKTVRIWDVQSGQLLRTLSGHDAEINAVAFNPSGDRLVSASGDGTLRLWEVSSGRLLARMEKHHDVVHSAEFSNNGEFIASSGEDGTARVWSARDGAELRVLSGHKGPVLGAAFSADSQWLVSASADNTARLWEVASGRLVATLSGHEGRVLAAEFSPADNRILTTSWDHTARVWSGSSGQLLAVLPGTDGVQPAHFSRDGRRIVTCAEDKACSIWDSHTGEREGHRQPVNLALFSADETRVLTVSADHSAALWDADSGQTIATLNGHTSSVELALFSPDARQILTASLDTTARLWDALTGKPLRVLAGHGRALSGASFSPDGARIVTTSWDATARIWDAQSGRELSVLKGHQAGVSDASFSPNGERLVTSSWDGTTRIWELPSGRCSLTLPSASAPVYSATFDAAGRRVLTAADDGVARLWDASTGELVRTFVGHTGALHAAIFTPDQASIVTASDDHTARVWNLETGAARLKFSGHGDAVTGITLSAKGNLAATISRDQSARVWDLATGAPLATLEGHTNALSSVFFSANDSRILTASRDGSAALWDVQGDALRFFGSGQSPRRVVLRHIDGGERAELFQTSTKRWVDPRTTLWQELRFCSSTDERMATLGEGPEDAARGHQRCRDTVAACAHASFADCERTVEQNFDLPAEP
jgi:WD40 repeat protein